MDGQLFATGPGGEPPAEFAHRRTHEPLGPGTMPSGDQVTVAVRYADVREVLAGAGFTRELAYPGAPRMVAEADISDDPDTIFNMDPPRHTRIRRIVAGAFTPRRVEEWRPVVLETAERLADGFLGRAEADLVEDYAIPLPLRVICALLGVPAADEARFNAWAGTFLSSTAHTPEERLTAGLEFGAYIAGLLAERREKPGNALVDALLEARDEGEELTETELIRLIVILIAAGHETTANVLARGTLSLLRTGQYRALVETPGLIPGAVEEILRCEMPGDGGLLRVATRDVDLPSGRVPRGEAVMPSMAAANRDPAVFADPERFDITRGHCPHLSFGHGPHFCLGANLARLELQTGLEVLTRRFPELSLAVPAEDVPWRTGLLVRGPAVLPVRR